jgi:hypothetical protein
VPYSTRPTMIETFRLSRSRRVAGRARRSLSRPSGIPVSWALVAMLALSGALPRSAGAGQAEGQLLLRDFKPESMMRVAETKVDRARFPVIDVHNHANDARTLTRPHPTAAELVARMDRANIQRVVILTGGFGESLQRVLDEMVTPYPDRFTVFAQLDWSKVAEPGFSDEMVALLRDAVKRGARSIATPQASSSLWTIRGSTRCGRNAGGSASRWPFTSAIQRRSSFPSTPATNATRNCTRIPTGLSAARTSPA